VLTGEVLLEPDDAMRAHACVARLLDGLRALADDRVDFVAHELALVEAYARTIGLGDERCFDRYIARAIHGLVTRPVRPTLWGGVLGVAFVLEHVADCDDEALEEIDRALHGLVAQPTWRGSFDLIDGLVGIGVYALARLPRRIAAECLEGVVGHLERLAQGGGWWTPPSLLPESVRKKAPDGQFNLGVAHGTPGALAMLACAWRVGCAPAATPQRIRSGARWLLERCLRDRRARSSLAWCCGELGIATALGLTARAIDDVELRNVATDLAAQAAMRPFEEVRTPGLCHGAAGVAHMFHRIARANGDAVAAQAARRWFRRTLELAHDLVDDPGLLTGAGGVALAFIAACSTSAQADWDRLFLMS
jgi:hypothetical protein